MWGLDEIGRDSQGFNSVNPTYLSTARPGGIFFEISPFKNRHDRVRTQMITQSCLCEHF